jgi:hypothetical protein
MTARVPAFNALRCAAVVGHACTRAGLSVRGRWQRRPQAGSSGWNGEYRFQADNRLPARRGYARWRGPRATSGERWHHVRSTGPLFLVALFLVGCGQSAATDGTGARAFEHEGRWFIATCEEIKEDLLGGNFGTVPFEDTSLRLRSIHGVERRAAVAIDWEECESSWTLATAGDVGDAPEVEAFREVLR